MLYDTCHYLSMPGLKLYHASKRGSRRLLQYHGSEYSNPPPPPTHTHTQSLETHLDLKSRTSIWIFTSVVILFFTWWRHQMETFSALLAICAGNSPVPGEFPAQRPVTRSFDVYFDLRLNKRLSKQSWGWWFETPTRSFWRQCNEIFHQARECVLLCFVQNS